MKFKQIKKEVYRLTGVAGTKQLRQQRPELVDGKDLRFKLSWQTIHKTLTEPQTEDLSLEELDRSEAMLRQSLQTVGALAGLSDAAIETDWQRIKLENQFSDIHIEDL